MEKQEIIKLLTDLKTGYKVCAHCKRAYHGTEIFDITVTLEDIPEGKYISHGMCQECYDIEMDKIDSGFYDKE